jgi:hypothetical protein
MYFEKEASTIPLLSREDPMRVAFLTLWISA